MPAVPSSQEARAVTSLLQQAQVPSDGVLFVHSAFRALSQAGFRADAFVAALADYMAPGTLVMPTMTWRLVTPETPFFDEISTPSHVGVIPELFRQTVATHRSLHPTHSVAAIGRLAEALLSGHHLDDTPCSPNSPYGRARKEDAHILLLGIGFERCTAIHVAEETAAIDVYLEPASQAGVYECRSRSGVVHQVRLRRHLRLNRNFPQFEAPLDAAGKLRRGNLAGASWLAVTQRDLLDLVLSTLTKNPHAIIAPPGAPIIP